MAAKRVRLGWRNQRRHPCPHRITQAQAIIVLLTHRLALRAENPVRWTSKKAFISTYRDRLLTCLLDRKVNFRRVRFQPTAQPTALAHRARQEADKVNVLPLGQVLEIRKACVHLGAPSVFVSTILAASASLQGNRLDKSRHPLVEADQNKYRRLFTHTKLTYPCKH